MSTARENQFAFDSDVVRCFSCAATQRATRSYTSVETRDSAGIMARIIRAPE